jgi:hypothetical protein
MGHVLLSLRTADATVPRRVHSANVARRPARCAHQAKALRLPNSDNYFAEEYQILESNPASPRFKESGTPDFYRVRFESATEYLARLDDEVRRAQDGVKAKIKH